MDELIKTIVVNKANFDYCGEKGVINGTLYIEIKRVMKKYADEQVKSALAPVSGRSEQFTLKQLWMMAQKYNQEDFCKIVKEIEELG